VGALTGTLAALRAHDLETDAILARQTEAMQAGLRRYDDDLRQAMRQLGFSLGFLPADQPLGDFYSAGFAAATMPEDNARRLAEAGLVSAAHFVPVLQRKVVWEERGRTVLVQAWGPPQGPAPDEGPPPEVVAVPRGSLDLGYELHRGLNLQPGERVSFLGTTFAVRACRPESGTHDDISVWLDLRDAQERLGLAGRISQVRALACRTSQGLVLETLREEVAKALPGVRVVAERGQVLTLAEARAAFESGQQTLLERLRTERLDQRASRARAAWGLCGLALVLAAGASGALAWHNARERCGEMALWTALGASAAQVYGLLAWRALLVAAAGAALGLAGGGLWWGWPGAAALVAWALGAVGVAAIVVLPASLAAAALALRQDPAAVLKNES